RARRDRNLRRRERRSRSELRLPLERDWSEAFELLAKSARGLDPDGGIGRHGARDDVAKRRGKIGAELAQGLRLAHVNEHRELCEGLGLEGPLSRNAFVENDAERVDVGTRVELHL